jgi:glycosyltransferase involved in cell wall biosynthesis
MRPAAVAMPRVLLVSQPTDGGVFRHVCDLAQGLPAHGFDVALAAPPLSGPPPAATVRALPLVRAPSPVRDARATWGLVRAMRALRPDIVHAHSSKAGAVARLARLLAPGTPIVYTPHGYAHAGYFESPAQRLVYRSAERALTPLASRVVCVCEAERQLALGLGAGPRARVVYNGIGPPPDVPVHPEVAAMRERGPVIATVTLLRPGKGIETLLDALPGVLSVHPGAQLAIAGTGVDREPLERRAGALGVATAVRFLGFVPETAGVLRGADVFVSSSWAESFPYVVLEAMALARPIVATRVGGVAEAVRDGESGLLVAPRDAETLAGALARLLSDPTRAAEIGAAARSRVTTQFTRERMLESLAAVFSDLLA